MAQISNATQQGDIEYAGVCGAEIPDPSRDHVPVSCVTKGEDPKPAQKVVSLPKEQTTRDLAKDDNFTFSGVLFCFWAVLVIFYGLFAEYGDAVLKSGTGVDTTYLFYHNITIMIFVGFGFLMTFLHRYAYAAVGYTFLVSMLSIYWGVLCTSFFHQCYEHGCDSGKLNIDMVKLIYGLFAAGAVMISFGGVLGKVTILQLLVMSIIEVPIFCINEHICANIIGIQDVGGAITIHLFGAYFGLTICMVRRNFGGLASTENKPSVDHDIFSMIGTLFLWICWPSFNAALAANHEEQTILNTVMSIGASCVMAFMLSSLLHTGKFEMAHIQNATLAGGVAMGAAGDLVQAPVWAMVVGSIAGVLSVIGYTHIQPFLFSTFKLHDTCGIHNLHGMPGVIGAFVSIIAVQSSEQASKQALGMLVAFGFAIGGGIVTSIVISMLRNEEEDEMFIDDVFWVTPVEPTAQTNALETVSQHGRQSQDSARHDPNHHDDSATVTVA